MNDVISLKNFLNIGHYPKFYLKDRNGNFEFFAIGENGGISNFKIHLQGFNSNTDATWIKNIKTTNKSSFFTPNSHFFTTFAPLHEYKGVKSTCFPSPCLVHDTTNQSSDCSSYDLVRWAMLP